MAIDKNMDIDKLLEELNLALGEEDVKEDTLVDEAPEAEPALEEPAAPVEPEEAPKEEPTFKDSMSLADTFDAKAKIARALDNLKASIEEFKDATAEKVDLINDGNLLTEIEGLDRAIEGIETALAAGELLPSALNDPFNTELPELPAEPEFNEEELHLEDDNEHDLPEEDDDEAEEEEETPEVDFNEVGGLTLLKDQRDEEV